MAIFAVDAKGAIMYPEGQDAQNQAKLGENLQLLEYLLGHIREGTGRKMQRNTLMLAVLLLCFQQYVPLDHPIHL